MICENDACLCLCLCLYLCLCLCLCMHVVCVRACVHACMHACVCVCERVSVYVYVCVCVCTSGTRDKNKSTEWNKIVTTQSRFCALLVRWFTLEPEAPVSVGEILVFTHTRTPFVFIRHGI